MPFAESSPVRRYRHANGWTQKELADRTGLSASTISVIERLRNPFWIEELERLNLEPTLTTVEVATRILAAFGLLQYGRTYSLKQVVQLSEKMFREEGLTDRPARCRRPYPGATVRHLRAVA